MELITVKKILPEYKKILEMAGGHKPRKFVEKIEIVECPTIFNPSGLGDYAYRTSYYVDKDGKITSGIGYCYDTMMSVGVNPVDRVVDVPSGTRFWVVTWDGIWGGHWEVKVFVHKGDHKLWINMITASALKPELREILNKERLRG